LSAAFVECVYKDLLSNQIKSNLFEDNNRCQTGLKGRKTCANRSPKHNQRRDKATQNTKTTIFAFNFFRKQYANAAHTTANSLNIAKRA